MLDRLFKKDFVLLWLGQAVSQIGNGAGFIATLWWVQSTTGSGLALGTLAMVQTLAGVLLSPVAGVMADRLSKKSIIVCSDFIRGLVYCYLAWATYGGTLRFPVLLLAAAINSACNQFFNPAITAAIPFIVPKQHLVKANSLRQMTEQSVNVLGYAMGGLLVAMLGVPLLLLVDGISFLLSAVSETFIQIPLVAQKAKVNWQIFWSDLREGMAYAQSDRVLSQLLKVMVVINFCFVPFSVLLPKLVASQLGGDSRLLGYISAAQMLGMLFGTLLISLTPIVKQSPWIFRWGLTIQAAALAVIPFLPASQWAIHLVIYALFGALNSIINICFFTTLQRKVDRRYLGKVASFAFTMAMAMQPLSSALSGLLADRFSVGAVYVGAGLLAVFSNLLMLRIAGLGEYFEFTTEPTVSGKIAAS